MGASLKTIGYVCPICNMPNPMSTNYCLKCGHWLLDTQREAKPITESGLKGYFTKDGYDPNNKKGLVLELLAVLGM